MNKSMWGALGIIFIGVIAWYFLSAPTAAQPNGSGNSEAYSWEITEIGESETGAPRTAVFLIAGGEKRSVGEFDGSCSEIKNSSWSLLESEVAGVICWWAGGGSEIGIFNEGGRHVVKVGALDEGSAETAGFRGDFKTIFSL